MIDSGAANANVQKMILVIDDEHMLNESIQRKFKKLGCETEGCFDGEQGLNKMKEKKYDCIVLDLMMPIKDGFAVLTERKTTMNADTPVYVMTALAEEKYELAKVLGANDVFTKTDTDLAKIIQEINSREHLGNPTPEAQ